MPLIEVLPNSSTTTSAPGWAYVPDTGYDPSKAAIQPSGTRQRGARNVSLADGAAQSLKQQNAVVKRLNELDKDNHRDVQIPVPSKQVGGTGTGTGRPGREKTTPAVRRILQSQKTFLNHLADEEAQLAQQTQSPTSNAAPILAPATPAASKQQTAKGRRSKASGAKPLTPQAPSFSTPAAGSAAAVRPSSAAASAPMSLPVAGADDVNPLLRAHTPMRPPSPLLEELLSAPPLPYAAARSKPSALGLPPTHFCEICGYWGKVRCLKCGARVCGLECKGAHDDQRCPKFFA